MKSKAQPVGLAQFIREVTPHIDPENREMTRRGLFKCKHGHTFTAVISDKEKVCRQCNEQSQDFADMLRVKMMLKDLAGTGVACAVRMPAAGQGAIALSEQRGVGAERFLRSGLGDR